MLKRTIFFVVTCVLAATAAQPATPERAIASQLRSDDATQQRLALEALEATDKQLLTPEVKAALADALVQESKKRKRRYWEARAGKSLAPLSDPELVAALARAVAETGDPRAIPAMAESLGPGFSLVRALARFGSEAVPDVVRTTLSADSTHDAVNHGLVTLRMIVERAGGPGLLKGSELEQIRRVAAHHLTNRPRFISTLWWAIDLAAVLEDPLLRTQIERLAVDAELAVRMGAWDPDVVAKTQQRAKDRLAGVPPLPRR